MSKNIKEILNNLIVTLEEMNDEKTTLKLIYQKHYNKVHSNHEDDDDDFYSNLIEQTLDHVDISDFEMNDLTSMLYYQNLEKTQTLEATALKLYRLIDTEIPFMEELKSEKAQEMEILQEKQFITVQEFSVIYGYSATQQKSLRARLRDPIPFSQKGHGHKVLYERRKVQKWLGN